MFISQIKNSTVPLPLREIKKFQEIRPLMWQVPIPINHVRWKSTDIRLVKREFCAPPVVVYCYWLVSVCSGFTSGEGRLPSDGMELFDIVAIIFQPIQLTKSVFLFSLFLG